MSKDCCATRLTCGPSGGLKRHRLTLQKKSDSVDANGNRVDTWTDVATVHAQLEPMRGRELFYAQQVSPEITHKITMDYRSGVTHAMRFKFGDRVFGISSIINPMEANRSLEIVAKEAAT